jgi:thiamine-monophosphate kinase
VASVTGLRQRGEFELIAKVLAPLARSQPGAFGLADDAAVLSPRPGHELVITTDAMIAGVHFAAGDPPDLIARKLLRVNLSDLAAMGAGALGYVLVVNLDQTNRDRWMDDFARGLAVDQDAFGVGLLGGDTTAGGDALGVSMTVFGEARKEALLRRNGAKAGDLVYVSGTIGDAALGLGILQGNVVAPDETALEWLVGRLRLPSPRLELGCRLGHLASAAIDVSDGLIADLEHVCACSGVGAEVDFGRVPLSDAARDIVAPDAGVRERILGGGEDYELVFTISPDNASATDVLARDLALALTPIGRIVAGAGVRVRAEDGGVLEMARKGYVHF